jgi:4-hydroxy-2-oxoglutarate aldolase
MLSKLCKRRSRKFCIVIAVLSGSEILQAQNFGRYAMTQPQLSGLRVDMCFSTLLQYEVNLNFRGILPPLCTHFHSDGSVDLDALRENVKRYNRSALLGYVVTGSTGEAVMLSEDEKIRVWATVAEIASPDKMLIAGTAAQSTVETVSLAKSAGKSGYHAALVLTPSFFRAQMLNQNLQLDFFAAVADASPIPIILYNFPQMTGIDLDAETLARAGEHENVAAIKESSAEMSKIEALRKALPVGTPLLVGASAKFDECLMRGADGGILAIANALPNRACRILTKFSAGDIAGARAEQNIIREAAGTAPKHGIQGLKYAMEVRGFKGGPCRHPLPLVTEDAKTEIRATFEALAD